MEAKGFMNFQQSALFEKIHLPFVLVSTKDCPENELEFSYGDQNKTLNIAMKKPLKCIGDADTLVKMELYRVNESWIRSNIPEQQKVLGLLNEK